MRDLFRRLFPLHTYTDPIQRRQALGTYASAMIVLIGLAAIFLTNVARLIFRLPGADLLLDPGNLLRGILLFGVAGGAVELTRRGRQVLGAGIIVVGWLALCFALLLFAQQDIGYSIALMLIGISLGALLIGEKTVPVTTVTSIAVLVGNLWINPGAPGNNNPARVIFSDGSLIVMHALVNYALAQGMRAIARQVATSSERRYGLAEASGKISQHLLTTRLNLDVLLKETVNLTRQTFSDVDEAQLFLVDKEHQNARLVATTHEDGAQGAEQQAAGQQVGSLSVIGRVTISGQSVIARSGDEGQLHRRSAFLPGTQVELAIPLHVGDETIGALDLQSRSASAFTNPDDIQLLETLCNQIAIAIDNARLYAEAQQRLADNQRLYDQTRASLREIERLNQQLIGGAWAEYLRSAPVTPAYTLDLVSGQAEEAAEWTHTMGDASLHNKIVTRSTADARIVAVPISVRGQVVGAMEFEIDPAQDISPAHIAILQNVVERLGLAAENARLLEEAQRIAQREALVNEISARLQTTTNVEAVVAAATQSLADAFQSPRVSIRLGTPAETVN